MMNKNSQIKLISDYKNGIKVKTPVGENNKPIKVTDEERRS